MIVRSTYSFKSFQVPVDSKAQFTGYVPLDELDITYSRSSDERGQNVNCVNTAVDIKFNVHNASWLSDEVKRKLVQQVCNLCFLNVILKK